MRRPSRVTGGFALVAVLGTLAVAADVGSVVLSAHAGTKSAAAAPQCATSARGASDPYAVAQAFLKTAVERKNLSGSYALATPGLRRGVSCAQWVKGKLPIAKVANIDWSRSGYKVVTGGPSQLVLRILLFQPNAALPAPFLMELRESSAGWRVGTFEREGASTAGSAALAA